jgi:hypothetical protein
VPKHEIKVQMPATPSEWKKRRRLIYFSLAFVGFWVSYILVGGADTALNAQAMVGLLGAGTAVLTGYVFGAVWDDRNRMNSSGGDLPSYMQDTVTDVVTDDDDAPPISGGS